MGKRTEATVEFEGKTYIMSKGAPQVMITLAHNAEELRPKLNKTIDDFAQRGYRMLGVAQKIDTGSATDKWEFVGLIPLHDPPRHDTAKTIEALNKLSLPAGVDIKIKA